MVMPIIPRGPIDDLAAFERFSTDVPALSPPTPDRQTPDVFLRRVFYGGLPLQMPDGAVVDMWGFFDPATGAQKFPSEAIRVREGQIVHVELTPGRNTHTIHHHGIEPTPFNDGVGHHSFEVAGSYTYQWKAAKSGTYFYHCHKNTVLHFELGMYGALIIDPPSGQGWVQRADEEIRYDVEAIWVADDVDPMWHMMGHSAGIGFPFGPDVGLNHFDPMYHMISGVPSPNTKTDPRVVVNCAVGDTVLLRLINGAYALLRTTIQGLDTEVIEMDGRSLGQAPHGAYNQPFTVPAGTPFEMSTAQRRGMLVKPTQPGTYKVTFEFVNQWANIGKVTTVETFINVGGVNQVRYLPVQGKDRYQTNAQVSLNAFPGTAPTAIIATGRNWPDALAGSALAGASGGPLLLVEPTSVPAAVEAEMRRLGVRDAVIIGGSSSVSGVVRTALEGFLGTGRVSRIAGSNRYDTAAKVAEQVKARRLAASLPWDGTAFVVSGLGFADALSASPLAAAKGWPILLATPTSLPGPTLGAIGSLGITKVVIVGGPKSIGLGVQTQLENLLGIANVDRIEGLSRYDTSVAMAEFGAANGLDWVEPAVASGDVFPDALGGGVMQGVLGSPILLTPGASLDPAVRTALVNQRAFIRTVRFVGGTATLTPAVRSAVQAALA